jgi:hypothetical protein
VGTGEDAAVVWNGRCLPVLEGEATGDIIFHFASNSAFNDLRLGFGASMRGRKTNLKI